MLASELKNAHSLMSLKDLSKNLNVPDFQLQIVQNIFILVLAFCLVFLLYDYYFRFYL